MEHGEQDSPAAEWRVPPGTWALVAEDDIVSSTLLSYLLRACGCEVDIAMSGEEAVSRFTSRPYAVAFLDLLLPGMTGLAAAHQIRLYPAPHPGAPAVRIVGMSTLPLNDVWKSCAAAGMDAFLAKPIQRDDVVRVLQHVFPATPAELLSPTGGVDVVDLHALLQRLGGDSDFLRELASGFLNRCPAMLVEIRDALWRSDREQLAHAAHRLSGSAAEFGALRVLGVTHELERLGRAGDMRQAQALLPALEEAVTHMQLALKRVRDHATI